MKFCALVLCACGQAEAFVAIPRYRQNGICFGTDLVMQAILHEDLKEPLVDIPLRRLDLPRNGVGQGFVIVPVDIKGIEEWFILDSGQTIEMVSIRAAAELVICFSSSVS
jgi:hypothetical protein